jgi:hypothetical protein
MIRIELIETRKDGLHTMGLYQLVDQQYFELVDLDSTPRLQNPRSLYFEEYTGKKRVITHLGLFPALEYTGVVVPLTVPMEVEKSARVNFPAGSITMSMLPDTPTRTVTKGP